ncbi:hypothetical protein LOTGIDRAFT_213786 [Lottia gigantea]|uniref:Uncharacterized protein n=1 Tax=Lottia gigantea TaxID=225164 RepID=V4AVE8_LOTGI|nr:hypothetical protein LOTGIDRAFT_213786 [Lottia gigantea]ESO98975.1 hypothetical protein LOTGIDRAFT_213786 [Lottia gigantea]
MKYSTVEERLSTFVGWPHRHTPYPLDLARAGFYYIGPGDRVRCAYCNGDLNNWSATDNPLKEHIRLLPLCPFLDGSYKPVKVSQESKSGWVQTKRDRLKSFIGWNGQVDPRQLAHAGFYYLGNSDRVQCFSCQTIFRDWVAGDDPWIEHSKWYPDCPYIQLCLGKEIVKEIRRNVLKNAPIDVVDCVH